MTKWRHWQPSDWNISLLDHFFRKKEDLESPIINLLVTPDELARATGDRDAIPSDVRDAFVSSVVASIRRSGSLIKDASDYQLWPDPPVEGTIPRFVSHLLFTCIA